MKQYTLKEAASVLGVSKSTIVRRIDQLPPEEISATTYRGHAATLLSEAALHRLALMLNASNSEDEANHNRVRNDSGESGSESIGAKDITSETDLVSLLRAELEAKNQQISDLSAALLKTQDALAAAQALHAATAEQLRLLSAPKEDDDQAAESDEPPAEHQEDPVTPAPEAPIVQEEHRPTLRERLRYLFTGAH